MGLDLLANVGGTVSCLFLVGVCHAFYSSGLVLTIRQLLLVGVPGISRSQELTGYAHTVVALPMNNTCPLSAHLCSRLGKQYAAVFTSQCHYEVMLLHNKITCGLPSCLDLLKV